MINHSLEAAGIAMQANIPIFIVGQPGVAKTSLLTLISTQFGEHGYETDVIHPALYEPTDFTGLPIVTKAEDGSEMVRFAPPFWAINAVKKSNEHGGHVIIFDEVTCAPPATQSALMRPILERRVGDLQMPLNTLMIMIGNPPSQAAGGWDIAKPLMNRVVRLDWTLPFQAWADYMLSGDPMSNVSVRTLPDNWEEHRTAARAIVVSYLTVQPSHYSPDIPSTNDPLEPFATPRSWFMATQLMAACKGVGYDLDSSITRSLVAGCVGTATMLEFANWVTAQDLPDPEKLLADPQSLRVLPDRDDLNFAIFTNVASTAVAKGDYKTWCQGWEVLGEAVRQGKTDIAAAAARTLGNPLNIPKIPGSNAIAIPPAVVNQFEPLLRAIQKKEKN